MAGIWLKKAELINELFEVSGYKTGLCFSFSDMQRFIGNDRLAKLFESNRENVVRIRSEEYEILYFRILRGAGHIPQNAGDPSPSIGTALYKYKDIPEALAIFEDVYSLFPVWMNNEVEKGKRTGEKTMSPEWFITESKKRHGTLGVMLSLEIIQKFIAYQETSPWNSVRRVNWVNTIDLKELFISESLDTFYGSFLDQRYIDYLSNHLDDIGSINWRKFEGLTCEYFKKKGYYVEIGSGRNDGGIDARIWKSSADKENPPMIIVQCKRQKDKIEKVVVKALWADVLYEEAESGLVVTSSEVSQGARTVCSARGYNIRFAERETLSRWITSMRTPYRGLTL